MKQGSDKENNVYALNVKEQIIHVSEAESGRKGYLCLGCQNDLEAVKSKTGKKVDFFRHVPRDVKGEKTCTYRDETYRHKLAKEILQRIMEVKVPAVYKFPPKGSEGLANSIREAELVRAFSVGIERTFYEDEFGEIKWGVNPEVDEKFLLVRPDVTFFDENNNPILFIELVATHGISNEKRAKLSRIGIDCIQVRIPKESPQEIEAAFSVIERTKWIYNHEESVTNYISVPNSDSTGIPPIDEQQRKLFSESFNCRQAQINNLIRTIKRCLESKPYRSVEESIRSELSRVERNSTEHQSRLEELRRSHRIRIEDQFRDEIEEFEIRRKEYHRQETEFWEYSKDLEKRYYSKREELEREKRFLDDGYKDEIKQMDGEGKSIEDRKRDLDRVALEIRGDIEREESEIDGFGGHEKKLIWQFERDKIAIIREFESKEKYVILEDERIKLETERISDEEIAFEESIKREEETLPGWFGEEEGRIEIELEGLRRRIDETIKLRSINGGTELSSRISKLLEAREILNDYSKKQAAYRRNRTAWECYRSGTYKNWN